MEILVLNAEGKELAIPPSCTTVQHSCVCMHNTVTSRNNYNRQIVRENGRQSIDKETASGFRQISLNNDVRLKHELYQQTVLLY